MSEWAVQNPNGFGFILFCAIASVTIIGVAFAIAISERRRQ